MSTCFMKQYETVNEIDSQTFSDVLHFELVLGNVLGNVFFISYFFRGVDRYCVTSCDFDLCEPVRPWAWTRQIRCCNFCVAVAQRLQASDSWTRPCRGQGKRSEAAMRKLLCKGNKMETTSETNGNNISQIILKVLIIVVNG